MKVKVFTELNRYDPEGTFVKIFVREERNGKRYNWIVNKGTIESKEMKEGMAYLPFIQMPIFEGNEFMQKLANELWEKGIKPEKQKNTENELAAIKNHLADMRRLVFRKTKED